MSLSKVMIVPTGDELIAGVIVDTNSPAIKKIFENEFPECAVCICEPVSDNSVEIGLKILQAVADNFDFLLFIGGSGGGNKCDPTLTRDCTHTAILGKIPIAAKRDLFGYNGHLWARLLVGFAQNTLVANVPGPYVEAIAGAQALSLAMKAGVEDCEVLVDALGEAVAAQYPKPITAKLMNYGKQR